LAQQYREKNVAIEGLKRSEDGKDSHNMMESAYLKIKNMIFGQQIVPGQKLIYRELAKALSMSSTPVQFALGRLEQEGFIERIPNVGYYVRKINLQEIEDLFDLRLILELYAVEMAIGNQTPEDIRLLEELQQDHKNYSIQIYDRRKLILDAAFHSQIAAMSRNGEIVKELRRIFEHAYLRSPVERIPPVRLPIAAAQHEEIVQRIRERDVAGARESLGRHIREAKEARRAMLEALPSMELSAASM